MLSLEKSTMIPTCEIIPDFGDSSSESPEPYGSRPINPYRIKKTLESTNHLGEVYSISLDEVRKVLSIASSVQELYILVGIDEQQRTRCASKTSGFHKKSIIDLSISMNNDLYNFIHFLFRFVSVNGEGSWVKLLKWKFADFFAFCRNQDLPPCPEFKRTSRASDKKFFTNHFRILGGLGARYLGYLKANQKELFWIFVNSSLQYKKAMPSVPESMLEKTTNDTFDELTGPKRPPPSPVTLKVRYTTVNEWITCNKIMSHESIKTELRRSTRELFGSRRSMFTKEHVFKPFVASSSANYNNTRSELGAIGHLYESLVYGQLERNPIEIGSTTGIFSGKYSRSYGKLGQIEDSLYKRDESFGYGEIECKTIGVIDSSELSVRWEGHYRQVFQDALHEEPYVTLVALAEPLKVRVISKGPPSTYTVLKPFQKWMWRILKDHKVFSLIGRYVTEEDIDLCIGELEEGEEVVSGDYVSSTNRLCSWVTETILDELFNCIGENIGREDLDSYGSFMVREEGVLKRVPFLVALKILFKRALTRHLFQKSFVDPASGVFKTDIYPQTEGQLMGSIISFPFLCIANAALCRYSLELSSGKSFTLVNGPKQAPLLVNGDDCILKGRTSQLRQCWETVTAMAGLSSSVGKTYFSNTFLTINSTLFEFDPLLKKWKEEKYINLGLMMGKNRAVPELWDSPLGIEQVGQVSRELKRSCPKRIWPLVKKRFLYYNGATLRKYPGIPWNVPEFLGGLGIPIDNPNEVGRTDRMCCSAILKYYELMRPILPKEMPQWLMHKLVLKEFKLLEVVHDSNFHFVDVAGTRYDLKEAHQSCYSSMVCALLQFKPLEDLYHENEVTTSIDRSMWHNVNLWAKARRMLSSEKFTEMTDEQLIYEKKEFFVPIIDINMEELLYKTTK